MSGSLVYVNRAALPGQPVLHALVVGVSDYVHLAKSDEPSQPRHYGMRQLSSAALTGYKIYQRLLERRDRLPVPLGTVRLLLSPSPTELQVERTLQNLAPRASLDNFLDTVLEWREDARTRRDNMTLFYFTGHGVQRIRGAHVILLEEFAHPKRDNVLHYTVDTDNLLDGMVPSKEQKEIARTQLYFIDACRITPEEFLKREWMNTTQIWTPFVMGEDDRFLSIFHTALPGARAYAFQGDQSIFSKALINCLNGGAGVRVSEGSDEWCVTTTSLAEALQYHMNQVTAGTDTRQEFRPSRFSPKIILHHLDGPPAVEVILEVDPTDARVCAGLRVCNDEDETVLQVPPPLDPHPYRHPLPAGIYRVSARIQPPTPPYIDRRTRFFSITPPQFRVPPVRVCANQA